MREQDGRLGHLVYQKTAHTGIKMGYRIIFREAKTLTEKNQTSKKYVPRRDLTFLKRLIQSDARFPPPNQAQSTDIRVGG